MAVLVGSFVAQTHVGYVALALPLVALGAAWLLASHRRDPRRLNATFVVRWFREAGTSGEGSHTLLEGWRVVSAQYAPAPDWLAGTRPVNLIQEPIYVSDPGGAGVVGRRGSGGRRAVAAAFIEVPPAAP